MQRRILLYIGLTASRIVIIGNYMLRRPRHSKIEVVAPKEEEEEEEDTRILFIRTGP
jgi:hypothetical protein